MNYNELNKLANTIYEFMYDRIIHKRKREALVLAIKEKTSTLNENEKAYVREKVFSMFDELMNDHSKTKKKTL